MSRLKNGSIPSYRLHKARNCAVVTLDGRDHYLGPFGSPSSKQKYAGLIRVWQQRQEGPSPEPTLPLVVNDRPTINELILVYLRHVSTYYKSNHGENKEAGCVDDALKVLQECGYGREPADSFRPKDLKTVRDAMVKKNWSRNYINCQINRIKRMFRHAVEEDLVSGTVYHALLAVRGLRRGTPGVRETKKVRPVPIAYIKAVLKRAHVVLKAMILFGFYTGARPGEICALKPRYLDRQKKVWVYQVPAEANKTSHHDHDRKVYVGPRAQKILLPWLPDMENDEYVFSPARSEILRQMSRTDNRKTPLWPSHVAHQAEKKKPFSKRAKRDHYDPASFRRAIKRLCDVAGVPRWFPNQLRHNAGTRFRKSYGVEVARILLGHCRVNVTELYAEPDVAKARKVASVLG